MTHLRIEKTNPFGPDRCSCDRPGCVRWRDEALEVAATGAARQRDLAEMAARLRNHDRGWPEPVIVGLACVGALAWVVVGA